MMHRHPDALLQLLRPRGSEPVPAAYDTAEAAFARATADYEAQRYLEAARGFLDAARRLHIDGPPYAGGFTGNRRICYRNAAAAFSASGDIAGGRQALAAAARDDPACADTLAELEAGLAPL
ncbi:MAG: hypothetical protein E6J91_39805 [Deltaproteobacteria bacterium]|nr:MAG: hypothetical protein E6J91_39805 [Deltaproteobacteria bacterium]